MKNSTENTKEPKLSPADYQFFTKHLLAIMNHPNAPESLQKGILEGIELLENEVSIKADNLFVIKNALLAYATDGFTVGTEQFEPKESELSLPELLSAAIKHPDMPENLRVDLWNTFANEVGAEQGDMDSPEWFAAALGIKNYRREADEPPTRNSLRIPSTGLFEVDPRLKAVKPLVDRIINYSAEEDLTVNALICLLESISQQKDFERAYFIDAIQSYAFCWTRDFDKMFEAYKANLDCSNHAPEQSESTEQSETYHAATVETHSSHKLDPMLGKQ